MIENSNSVFSTSDAEGPFRRAVFEMSCNSIHAILDQTNGAADALYGPTVERAHRPRSSAGRPNK